MSNTELTKNAEKILEERYLKRDEDGNVVETPEKAFERVAEAVAEVNEDYDDDRTVEEEKEEFYKALANLDFIPNSPTLMNAGLELGQLSACFVLSPLDDMDSIFQQVKNAAKIFQSGGGVGYTFSRLRPKGDTVKSTGGVASGPISFMRVYDEMCNTIKQGGRRRGAQMAVLSVQHPDIEEFIEAKDEEGELENFNISVALTEEFMEAVDKGEEYPLINPRNKEIEGHLDAGRIYDKIVKQAWKNGEPGILFLDRINEDNPFDVEKYPEHYIDATNPCGEQPLEDFEACNLGHINLSQCVTDGEVDWDKLEELADTAVRFLDNVIDASDFPDVKGYDGEDDAITKRVKENRKIGLGVMGWHHMLMRLGIPYDSEEAIDKAEEVMRFIQQKSKDVSKRIAEKRGEFPNWDESDYEERMRNATTTTIAPTGTTSMIADASGGIEPIFAVSYVKNVLDGESLVMPDAVFEEMARERGIYSQELMEEIAETGSLSSIDEVPEDMKEIFKTALEITPEWHIRMQAAFQEHVDNAISKTVNFPNEAAKEDIKEVYDLAYQLKCKGVTVYRSGSRQEQVMEVEGEKEEEEEGGEVEKRPRKRPTTIEGTTRKIKTGYGGLYVTINEDEHGMFEVFSQIGRAGGFTQSFTESLARLISLCLRSGIPIDEIIEQLEGIRSPEIAFEQGEKILSIPDAMAKALKWHKEGRKITEQAQLPTDGEELDSAVKEMVSKGMNPACPECGSMLTLTEGCRTCPNCGYSQC
ncbi:MAG: vitamin B12-dependent ribonucleotide reductase [Candidatus Thermoplasmatota archaeon]